MTSTTGMRFGLLLLVTVAVGCNNETYSTTEKAGGTVTLNGQPLPKATVLFQPIGKKDAGPQSSGMTDDTGRFVLTMPGNKKGAVIGKHRVLVSTKQSVPKADNSDMEEEVSPETVPESARTSPPEIEIPSGGSETLKVELNGPPPRKPGDPVERND